MAKSDDDAPMADDNDEYAPELLAIFAESLSTSEAQRVLLRMQGLATQTAYQRAWMTILAAEVTKRGRR